MVVFPKKAGLFLGVVAIAVMGWFLYASFSLNGERDRAVFSENDGEYIHPLHPFDSEGFVAGEKESREKPSFTFSGPIRGGLIPHHTLPAAHLTGFFRELAKQHPKTIILIGPNHPDAGQYKLLTSAAPWETPFGRVEGDASKAETLLGLPFAGTDEAILSKEHSIAGVLPFLRYFLPDTDVVPVVLNSHLSWSDVQAVSGMLRDMADSDTVVIAAVDFSHYLPAQTAEEKDRETEPLLRNFRSQEILPFGNDHVDSPVSIAMLLETMRSIGATHFDLLANTNSGRILSDLRSGTTSYFFAGFSGEGGKTLQTVPDVVSGNVKLLFGGDMMFDRWIRTMMRRHGDAYPLEPLRETFRSADAVIANLEGPITGNVSISETSEAGARDNYVFTFDREIAPLLRDFNIIPNLGNNHILNFKEDGARETEAFLRDAGVDSFGSPSDGTRRFFVRDFDGFRVAFVNYNEFVWQGREKAIEDIRAAGSEADFIVLYAHWGDEYEPATNRQKMLAREFVDAGADIVIGSHPHVVQEHETYEGKTIYYSLGNLVFDQYFRDETKNGLLVGVSIDPKTGEYEISEKPVIMGTDGQTRIK